MFDAAPCSFALHLNSDSAPVRGAILGFGSMGRQLLGLSNQVKYAQRVALRFGFFIVLLSVTAGCAVTFFPRPLEDVAFKERAQTQTRGGLTVTTAVPTRWEALWIYGYDLATKDMQPIWVEVQNKESEPYWFLPSGLDPNYFSVAEATYAFRASASRELDQRIKDHFQQLHFENPIPAGATVSGFVLVNRDEAFKVVDIDLIGKEELTSFTFIVVDPEFKGDYTLVDFDTLYATDEIVEIEDEETLRAALERLPCCTVNKKGTKEGDPLNLVLIGDGRDVFSALVRRNWHGTEIIYSKAVWRTIKSFLQGSRYLYSPISRLYVYSRPQDLAAQKARGTIHERNHLRIWLTPIRFRGKKVFVGQISRDIGVKFTLKSPTISTHVIDPDVDEARGYLLDDLAYSQALARFGYVRGVGEASKEEARFNLVGDPYYTDGLRVVMFFEPRPHTLVDIDFLEWELPGVVFEDLSKHTLR